MTMTEKPDKDIQELLSWLDQWLQKWRKLHRQYQTTPSVEERKLVRQRIKALEKELLANGHGEEIR